MLMLLLEEKYKNSSNANKHAQSVLLDSHGAQCVGEGDSVIGPRHELEGSPWVRVEGRQVSRGTGKGTHPTRVRVTLHNYIH